MVKLLITGTPRSGTVFISKVISALGVRCRHEFVFDSGDCAFHPTRLPEVDVEVSWVAPPLLDKLPDSVPLLHQVRHPLKVIRCILHNHFLRPGTEHIHIKRFMVDSCNDIDLTDELDAAIKFWIQWNEMIEPYAIRRFQIEQMTPRALQSILKAIGTDKMLDEIRTALELVPKDANRCVGDHSEELTWATVMRSESGEELSKLATKYGYSTVDE